MERVGYECTVITDTDTASPTEPLLKEYEVPNPQKNCEESKESMGKCGSKSGVSCLLKCHVILATLCFAAACIVSIYFHVTHKNSLPWFLFVGAGFGSTMTLHLFATSQQSTPKSRIDKFHLHAAFTVLASIGTFVAWFITHSHVYWFAPAVIGLTLPLFIHHWAIHHWQSEHRWLILHGKLFFPANAGAMVTSLCFTMQHQGPYWAIFFHVASVMLYLIHKSWHYNRANFLRLHLIFFTFCQVVLVAAWAHGFVHNREDEDPFPENRDDDGSNPYYQNDDSFPGEQLRHHGFKWDPFWVEIGMMGWGGLLLVHALLHYAVYYRRNLAQSK